MVAEQLRVQAPDLELSPASIARKYRKCGAFFDGFAATARKGDCLNLWKPRPFSSVYADLIEIEARASIQGFRVPVLLLQGDRGVQVTSDDAEQLLQIAGRRGVDIEYRLIRGSPKDEKSACDQYWGIR